ncbi:MAG: hypothetical protein ACI9MC_003967 [Kiritimatiellia bacterium]|jgi:hypothetical protein
MRRLYAALHVTLAGSVTGAAIGLAEGCYLLGTGDGGAYLLAYAWGLYGVLGAGVGVVVGSAWVLVTLLKPLGNRWAAGTGCGVTLVGMGLAIGRYLLNRDAFAEAGVPLWAMAALALVLVLASLFVAFGLARVPIKTVPRTLSLAGGLLLPGVLLATLAAIGGTHSDALPAVRDVPASMVDKPDVLFIMVDTLRSDHVIDAAFDTPGFDALRADAVTFDNAWAAASWTRASGASLWTSRLPAGHGAQTKASALPGSVETWSEVLQDQGVVTGALINNINMTAGFGFDQGFDHFVYASPRYPLGADASVFGLSMYKLVHRVYGRAVRGGVFRYYQPADVMFGQAAAFAESQRGGRYALFVHLMEPHDPYFDHPWLAGGAAEYGGEQFGRAEHPNPEPSQAPMLRDLYRQEVQHLDRELGRYLDGLRASGDYDGLLIVLTSDHGEEFYEHGGWWHGDTLHAEQTHVPLLVKLPGGRFAGTRASWQVRNIDVAPTIAAQLGVVAPDQWEGGDLFSSVEVAALTSGGEGPASGTGEALLLLDPTSRCRLQRGHPLDRDVVMQEDFEGNRLLALRREGLSWQQANTGNPRGLAESALFDVLVDPKELDDLLVSGGAICSRYPQDWTDELRGAADTIVEAAQSSAGLPVQVGHTEAQRSQLCALGYLRGEECR